MERSILLHDVECNTENITTLTLHKTFTWPQVLLLTKSLYVEVKKTKIHTIKSINFGNLLPLYQIQQEIKQKHK